MPPLSHCGGPSLKRKNSRAIFPFVLRVNSICLAAFEDNWTRSQEKERATEREEGIKESGFPLKLFLVPIRVCVGFFICDTRLDLIRAQQTRRKKKRNVLIFRCHFAHLDFGRKRPHMRKLEFLHGGGFYLFFNKSDTCGFYMASY